MQIIGYLDPYNIRVVDFNNLLYIIKTMNPNPKQSLYRPYPRISNH